MNIKDLHIAMKVGGWNANAFSIEKLILILDKINMLNWPTEFVNDTYKFLYVLENFIEANYLKYYKGDLKDATVLDLGANVGTFTLSIMDKQPKKVYSVEPMYDNIKSLLLNTQTYNNIKVIPGFVGEKSDWSNNFKCNIEDVISFKDLRQNLNLDSIDFLKCDCEGGERNVFTHENAEYILNNVKYISGEYHIIQELYNDSQMNLSTKRNIEAFKVFRDLYLLNPNISYVIEDRSGMDISDSILDDNKLITYANYFSNSWRGQYIFTMINNK